LPTTCEIISLVMLSVAKKVYWSPSSGASQFLESLYLGNLVVVKGEHKLL
jgi:hypothetical protein